MKSFLADVSDLIPPTVMAILFICLVVTILRVQNPRRRAATKQREEDAELADPRIAAEVPLWQAAKAAKKEKEAAKGPVAKTAKVPAQRRPHPASGPAMPGDSGGPGSGS